jgi:hypothetical protein
MGDKLDVHALLRRGGLMTSAEVKQLTKELTEAKLSEMVMGVSGRSGDQPVRVVPLLGPPPKFATGHFTRQESIWDKTPEEMEGILGVFGKFKTGAYILQFQSPLRAEDYQNKAYTHLPNGEEYKWNSNDKMYLPATVPVPQWRLVNSVPAEVIARLTPGQRFGRSNKI